MHLGTNLILASVTVLFAVVIIAQHVCIQLLINKVMSRNYLDYQTVKKEVGVPRSAPQGVAVDQEPAEDFGVLSELSNNII